MYMVVAHAGGQLLTSAGRYILPIYYILVSVKATPAVYPNQT